MQRKKKQEKEEQIRMIKLEQERRKRVQERFNSLKWIPAFMRITRTKKDDTVRRGSVESKENDPTAADEYLVSDGVEEADLNYLLCPWNPNAIVQGGGMLSSLVSAKSPDLKFSELTIPVGLKLNNRPQNKRGALAATRGSFYVYRHDMKGIERRESSSIDEIERQARSIFRKFDVDNAGYLNRIAFKKLLRAAGANQNMQERSFRTRAKRDFKILQEKGKPGISFTKFLDYYRHMNALCETTSSTFAGSSVSKPVPTKGNDGAIECKSPGPNFKFSKQYDESQQEVVAKTVKNSVRDAKPSKTKCVNTAYTLPNQCDTLSIGGLPSIVIAASKGDMDLVVSLARCSTYTRVLLPVERDEIVHAAQSGNVERLQQLMRDLFTRATQRKMVVDAMVSEDVELSRKRLKETYFCHAKIKRNNSSLNIFEPISRKPNKKKTESTKEQPKDQDIRLNQRLVDACLRNNARLVQSLLLEGADANTQDDNGSTPLIHCSWYGYTKIARILLQFGADCTIPNRRGNTPLHFTLEKNNIEMLYLFLSCGGSAALLEPNQLGKLPRDLCSDIFVRDISEEAMVLARLDSVMAPHRVHNTHRCGHKDGYIGKVDDDIRKACSKGNISMVKHILKTGLGSVNSVDRYGMSPLMHAVLYGRRSMVRYLLDNGADLYHATRNGNTALHFALEEYRRKRKDVLLEMKYKAISKLLLTRGGEKLRNMRNSIGKNAEEQAVLELS